MPIVRVKKRPGDFFLMAKEPIEDTRLSWKAKGLLAYLMSKPNDWQVWVKDLIKRSTDGRDAVLSGLRELRNHGYATREQPRRKDGTLGPVEYMVYESPQTGFPYTAEPLTAEPLTENPTHTNNDCSNNDLRKNESKLQQAKKPQPQSSPPTDQDDWGKEDHENFECILRSWVKEFGKLPTKQIATMIDLYNRYPVLEIHEYAWNEMVEARDKRKARPNLTYYEKCLETEARTNWVLNEGGNGHEQT